MGKKPGKKKKLRLICCYQGGLAIDSVLVITAVAFFVFIIGSSNQTSLRGWREKIMKFPAKISQEKANTEEISVSEPLLSLQEISVPEEIVNVAENPGLDTSNWPVYQSNWYGFQIKYPENWNKPELKSAVKGSNWEYRFKFRKKELSEGNPYSGFDVIVYSVWKVKELSGTDEYPKIKNEELALQETCQSIDGHLTESNDYPAEQIYIGTNDKCFDPAYFYSLIRDNYIYNIVPILDGEEEKNISSEAEITSRFPEFVSASSTFNLIDIKRPKPVPAKPKITAPKPDAVTKTDSQGRMICAKKNDKPRESRNTSKKHLDMECCLDPDEYPNPWCYYPPKK